MTAIMSIGLLILHLGFGLTLIGHGVQKLFGWFGGPGLNLSQALLFCNLAVAALLVVAVGILSSRKTPVPNRENVSKAS